MVPRKKEVIKVLYRVNFCYLRNRTKTSDSTIIISMLNKNRNMICDINCIESAFIVKCALL